MRLEWYETESLVFSSDFSGIMQLVKCGSSRHLCVCVCVYICIHRDIYIIIR